MNIHELKINPKYAKRFEKYSESKRIEVLYDYLFNGHSYRWLDENILGQDSNYSRGWQSMAILHYLGIIDVHKGMFKETSLDAAITILEEQDNKKFFPIIKMLKHKIVINQTLEINKQYLLSLEEIKKQLDEDTKESRKFGKKERIKRLKNAVKLPRILSVITTVYQRNADVVVEVLERANGACERCGAAAPFIRASDGTPYLEVHHKIRLADGGEDTVENAIAVCPNCHRELHFGINIK